jgi:hypothetical protein
MLSVKKMMMMKRGRSRSSSSSSCSSSSSSSSSSSGGGGGPTIFRKNVSRFSAVEISTQTQHGDIASLSFVT